MGWREGETNCLQCSLLPLGLCDPTLRLPMSPLLPENMVILENALREGGLQKKTIGK